MQFNTLNTALMLAFAAFAAAAPTQFSHELASSMLMERASLPMDLEKRAPQGQTGANKGAATGGNTTGGTATGGNNIGVISSHQLSYT